MSNNNIGIALNKPMRSRGLGTFHPISFSVIKTSPREILGKKGYINDNGVPSKKVSRQQRRVDGDTFKRCWLYASEAYSRVNKQVYCRLPTA